MRIRTSTWSSLLPAAALLLFAMACSDQLPTAARHPIAAEHPSRAVSSNSEGPTVSTDREDYAPGETVIIGGSGWDAGEIVQLRVVHVGNGDTDTSPAHQPWQVTADDHGDIASTWLVPADEDEAGATLLLTADGQSSGAHAEVTFTDLIGTVRIYSDAALTTSQTAFAWGATIYAQLTAGGSGTCYRIRWLDPTSNVVQTNTFGPGATSYGPPTIPSFTVPATGPSGTWSAIVDQNTGGTCSSFSSAGNAVVFDVARAVVIGAGTAASDATGGDAEVQENAPGSVIGATATTMFVQAQGSANRRAFLRFDLSPLALAATTVVTDAKVRLMVAGTPGSARTHNLQRANAAWSEGTLTWGNQPATTGAVATATVSTGLAPTAPGGDNQTWIRWNVTADVLGFVQGTFANNGWRINDANEGGSLVSTRYFTTEGTTCAAGTVCRRQVPVLLLDYSTVVPDATTTTTVIHSGDPTTDVAASGVTTVALGATVHDKATVSNAGGGSGNGTPQGTVAFTFWTDGTCGTGGGTASTAGSVSVDGSGIAHPSSSKGPLAAGAYSFRASFTSSDAARWSNSQGACEALTVSAATTTTALTVTPSTQQYSDKVTLSATVTPTTSGGFSVAGSVQFKVNGSDVGTAQAITSAANTATYTYTVDLAAPGPYTVRADFTSSSTNFSSSTDATSLAVTKEDATTAYLSTNPAALQAPPGGSLAANALTLVVNVQEKTPDLAATTAAAGNIANAGLSVSLNPIAGGSSIALTCTSALTGTGYAAIKAFTCKNASALAVGTYEVIVTVTGNYYTAPQYVDAFTVYDPSLGFATGGGTYTFAGERVSFGFTMKYTKSGAGLQGSLVAVRHRADGTTTRLKSNSLTALALQDNGCGVATFSGKATYTTWDTPTSQYVTTGSNAFTVYAEDCNNPGTGVDAFWLQSAGAPLLSMASPVSTNKATLTGGNIAIPHKPGR